MALSNLDLVVSIVGLACGDFLIHRDREGRYLVFSVDPQTALPRFRRAFDTLSYAKDLIGQELRTGRIFTSDWLKRNPVLL
jgi:hypothetical protein